MDVNQDFKEMLRLLNGARARYLIVGAYAVIHHSEPRYTKDLDIWVDPDAKNAQRVWSALVKFGAPLRALKIEDLESDSLIYQIGIEPNRIDIITSISAVQFERAWKNRVRTTFGSIPIQVLSKSDLIRNKKSAGRPEDLLDAHRLGKIKNKKKKSRKKR